MAATPVAKATGALRTIGEVASETGVPQHVLRFWETRFPQLRPLQRAGGRRYYRPDDVALVRRIASLLEREGYTIRGARQLLAAGMKAEPAVAAPAAGPAGPAGPAAPTVDTLRQIRDRLAAALADDERPD